jgi:hypothetical protein
MNFHRRKLISLCQSKTKIINHLNGLKVWRFIILDIVLDTLNQKVGGSTKYINQRDEEFIAALAREPIY